MVDNATLRQQAINLLAMAIVADTTQRYTTLCKLSADAAAEAGATDITEDAPAVQALVAELTAEDHADWDSDHFGLNSDYHPPPRE